MTIEGVTYRRFVARWRESGKRRQLTVWTPFPGAGDLVRALDERGATPDGAVRVQEAL